MKVLFDQGTPVPLRRFLHPHQVDTVAELGWSELQNGTLIKNTINSGYDVFVTTDQNLPHQQNLKSITTRIVVLTSTSWPRIQKKADAIRDAIDNPTFQTLTIINI